MAASGCTKQYFQNKKTVKKKLVYSAMNVSCKTDFLIIVYTTFKGFSKLVAFSLNNLTDVRYVNIQKYQ